jgi:putative ABC transport system permease protein
MIICEDARAAFRTLLQTPRFSLAAVALLGLSLGLYAGLDTMMRSTFLSPWTIDDPDSVLWVAGRTRGGNGEGTISLAEYEALRDRTRTFAALAGATWGGSPVALGPGSDLDYPQSAYVTGNFFAAFALRTVVGRPLRPSDNVSGATPVAVVSERWWRRRLGADPGAIGRTLLIRDKPVTLVGVISSRHEHVGISAPVIDLWMTIAGYAVIMPGAFDQQTLLVIGRLALGVSRDAAQREMDALTRDTYRLSQRSMPGVILKGTVRGIPPQSAPFFLAARFALMTLLLLVCANLGNLQLTRTLRRGRDLAVRLSLGATRARLAREIVLENVLLALAGATAGMALLWLLLPAVQRLFDDRGMLPAWRFDSTVIGGTIGLAFAASLVTALASWRRALRLTLRVGGTDPVFDRRGQAARTLLLGAQVALCTVLLGTTALLTRAIVEAGRINPGFAIDDVFALNIVPPQGIDAERGAVLSARIAAELESRGVDAGQTDAIPFDEGNSVMVARLPGQPAADVQLIRQFPMSPKALDLLGVRLVAGRHVRLDAAAREIVINESFARQFADGNAIGRTVLDRRREYRVVGIVADAQLTELSRTFPSAFPMQQFSPVSRFIVRGSIATSGATALRAVRDVDRSLRASVVILRDLTATTLDAARTRAALAGGVALLGLALACFGLYSVFGAVVEERTREIGIRMALGARTRHVVGHIVTPATKAAIAGALLGSGVTIGAGHVLRSLLYGLSPLDPFAHATVIAVLLAGAVAAALFPAARAARTTPAVTLRAE